jgi:tetratricopeptide (TPR) repeat protein
MIPVLLYLIKDMILRRYSLEESKINYLFGKADSLEKAGFFCQAVKIYEEILKKGKVRVSVLFNLGGLYYRKGMFEKAIPYYEKVIHINPKHYQGHYWLAMCYFKLKRYYAAIHTLEDLIKLLPTFKDALNLLGECYERIGEGAKAEHYYLKAITADPNRILIHGGVIEKLKQKELREERIKH